MGKYSGKKCRLVTMFGLTGSFFLAEIIVGYATNSMALVADSFHMLSDVVALIVAFLAVRMSPRKWSKNTFGWARAEVLGALINSVFLVALCFSILVESVKRFYQVEEIHNPQLILVVGVIGLVINVIGLFLFADHGAHGHSHGSNQHSHKPAAPPSSSAHPHTTAVDCEAAAVTTTTGGGGGGGGSHQQMNMRGVFLHVLADAIGSVIVVISALVIWKTEWQYRFYVDPVLSLVMVCLIIRSVWPLLMDSAMVLLQTVPTHIRLDHIEQRLLREIDGVLAVHEFHVWQLAGDRIIASAHVRCHNLADYMSVAEQIKQLFHNEGIHSTTIQPEFVDYESVGSDQMCFLDCPPSEADTCQPSKCCFVKKMDRGSARGPSSRAHSSDAATLPPPAISAPSASPPAVTPLANPLASSATFDGQGVVVAANSCSPSSEASSACSSSSSAVFSEAPCLSAGVENVVTITTTTTTTSTTTSSDHTTTTPLLNL